MLFVSEQLRLGCFKYAAPHNESQGTFFGIPAPLV